MDVTINGKKITAGLRIRHVLGSFFKSELYADLKKEIALDGKVLGWLGGSGKQLKQFGWIHEIACPSENELWVAEILNWRVQKYVKR